MSFDQITDNTSERQYFTTICNIIDDLDLSPLAIALYVHYKRWAWAEFRRPPGVRELQRKFKVHHQSIRAAKDELVAAGLIVIKEYDVSLSKPDEIVVLDVWERNFQHNQERIASAKAEKQCLEPYIPTDTPPVSEQTHPCVRTDTPLCLDRRAIKRNIKRNIKNKTVIAADAAVGESSRSEGTKSTLPPASSTSETSEALTSGAPTPHQRLMAYHHDRIGRIADGAAQAKNVQAILKHYDEATAIACYDYQLTTWRENVSWKTVNQNIAEWVSRGKPADQNTKQPIDQSPAYPVSVKPVDFCDLCDDSGGIVRKDAEGNERYVPCKHNGRTRQDPPTPKWEARYKAAGVRRESAILGLV